MALPNKTFWCNYNARNYNSTTLTLPKENGQLFDNDLVFPSAVTYNDDHITISGNKRIVFSFNNISDNIFNRTTSTATMTFIAKLAGTNNTWFVSNRDYSAIGWMVKAGTFTLMAYTDENNEYYFQQTNPKIFTWRCGNGEQQYICQTDNVIGTPYQTTDWVGRETRQINFFGGDNNVELWTGDFYWLYISPETLTDAEIQSVIDYNENPQTPLVQIPVNKYKLGADNIQKTYEGGTKINKMYVGNNLVYRALPTTTGPQLVMPLNEVWYKTDDGNSFAPKSNTYYIDSNENQLTYTESFDSVSGLWKMVFNGNVYGNKGSLYYQTGQNNRLLELWLPYGFVRPNDIFLYGQNTFEKFKGDSPAIVDNGNLVVCLVQDSTNVKDYAIQGVKTATTVTVPEGVVAIGGYCFHHLTATTVNFPSTITDIGYGSMEWSNITTLNCYATTAPTVDSMAWYMVSNNGTLHYPTGSDYSSFRIPSSWTKVGDL